MKIARKTASVLLCLLLVLLLLAPFGIVAVAGPGDDPPVYTTHTGPHTFDEGIITTAPTCGAAGVLTLTSWSAAKQ